jgi:hypothetical protein
MPRIPRISLIIAGKLIPNWISRFEFLRPSIHFIYSLDRGLSKRYCLMLGAGAPQNSWERLEHSNSFLISVPDSRLPSLLSQLVQHRGDWTGSRVMLSNSNFDSTALQPLRAAGAAVATLNHLASHDDHRFIHEGDLSACEEIENLLGGFVRKLYPVTTEGKTLFLAGMNFAEQISFATFAAAADLMRQAGLPAADARAVTERLFELSARSYAKGGKQRWNRAEGLQALEELHAQWPKIQRQDPVAAEFMIECMRAAVASLTPGKTLAAERSSLSARVRRKSASA